MKKEAPVELNTKSLTEMFALGSEERFKVKIDISTMEKLSSGSLACRTKTYEFRNDGGKLSTPRLLGSSDVNCW